MKQYRVGLVGCGGRGRGCSGVERCVHSAGRGGEGEEARVSVAQRCVRLVTHRIQQPACTAY